MNENGKVPAFCAVDVRAGPQRGRGMDAAVRGAVRRDRAASRRRAPARSRRGSRCRSTSRAARARSLGGDARRARRRSRRLLSLVVARRLRQRLRRDFAAASTPRRSPVIDAAEGGPGGDDRDERRRLPGPPDDLAAAGRRGRPRRAIGVGPGCAIVLGSGLGPALGDDLRSRTIVRATASFRASRRPRVPGHAGRLVLGRLAGVAGGGVPRARPLLRGPRHATCRRCSRGWRTRSAPARWC